MKISSAESHVMETLWRLGPLDSDEIFAALEPTQGWSGPTVRTLLGRLCRKKAVTRAKEGRRYVYRPLIERADYVQSESQSLLDRFFGGRMGALVAHFSERQALTDEEIAELRRLVDEISNDRAPR